MRTIQGKPAVIVASKVTSNSNTEYEYSSIKAFAEIELGNPNKRITVARRLARNGKGVVDGWNIRLV